MRLPLGWAVRTSRFGSIFPRRILRFSHGTNLPVPNGEHILDDVSPSSTEGAGAEKNFLRGGRAAESGRFF